MFAERAQQARRPGASSAAQVWRLPDLVALHTLRGHRRGVWAAAFSPVDQVRAPALGVPAVASHTSGP